VRCYAERGIATAYFPSVRASVCLSLTLRYRDHIGWKSSKNNFTGPVVFALRRPQHHGYVFPRGTRWNFGRNRVGYRKSGFQHTNALILWNAARQDQGHYWGPIGSHIMYPLMRKIYDLRWPLFEIQGPSYRKCRIMYKTVPVTLKYRDQIGRN